MKILQICIFAACVILFTGTVAAYTIAFTVSPEEGMAGETVTVTGTSTIPAGYTDEAVIYRQVPNFPPKQVDRYPFTIMDDGNWGFTIDTTGFLPSTYKIQLSKSGEYPYGSSAVLMQTFVVTAPPETSPSVATPALTPIATTSPEEIPTHIIPPEATTSPAGMVTALAAAGISASAFAYRLRRKTNKK